MPAAAVASQRSAHPPQPTHPLLCVQDLMAFNIRAWHASIGGAAVGRRSLNIDIFKDPTTPEQIECCNNAARGHASSM